MFVKWVGTHAKYDKLDVRALLKTVTVPVIKSDDDLEAALSRVESLKRSGDNEADDEIQVLGLLIHAYENVYLIRTAVSPSRYHRAS